jgi:maleate isomerase
MQNDKSIRLGFLIPPGNPNTEPEIIRMQGSDFTVHFTRMVAQGEAGSLEGQEVRNQSQIDHLPQNIDLLKMINPQVIALTHTATSYTLGRDTEQKLVQNIEQSYNLRFITAFGSVVCALKQIGAQKIALGTPYNEKNTMQCKNLLEAYGFEVIHFGRLDGVKNIYDETSTRALELAHHVNHPKAQAVFLSGVGMPTIDILEKAEIELKLPVISSIVATMWNALKITKYKSSIAGYGSLLEGKYD